MKNLTSFLIYLFLALSAFATKCGDDNPMDIVQPMVSVSDFTPTIDENPTDGQVLGTLEASTNEGSIAFSLTNQMPPGSFAIGASSGELTVADASLFDFETNPVLTATATAVNGTASATATITVTLNDVDETIGLMDFTATIDENPSDNQVLGTISATSTESPLTFSLSDQTPPGAFAINASSGELTVADASLFDFETNPILTATVTAVDGAVSETATITVTLNDIDETIGLMDFTTTIDENPSDNQVLGTISATNTEPALTFSLSDQTPPGAFAINASSGELTVADASLFDFESRAVLTATVTATATNGEGFETATITVNLTNLTSVITGLVDFTTTIEENPSDNQVLGTISATSTQSAVTFSLNDQTPPGAFAIDASSGELTVADASLFDFESRTVLTATVTATATNGESFETATITVNLTNIDEGGGAVTVSVSNFTATIDENPTNGQVLGLLTATTSEGSLTFALSAESPAGAFAINAATREITVLDNSLFDFETNPTLTATVTTTNASVSATATISVSLTNLAPTLSDLPVTIAENPTNGQSLGIVVGDLNQLAGTSITLTNPDSTLGALRLDLASGEVLVSDSLFFDFESRTSVVATVTATGELNTTVTITVTLTNVDIIWNGSDTVFTKVNFADPTIEANWDRITDSIAIMRGDRGNIYNPIFQTAPSLNPGGGTNINPINTLWAVGTTADLGTGTLSFREFNVGSQGRIIGGITYGGSANFDISNVVLYLPKEDIYIDVEFVSWQAGAAGGTVPGQNSGGGFSYRRTTRGAGQ